MRLLNDQFKLAVPVIFLDGTVGHPTWELVYHRLVTSRAVYSAEMGVRDFLEERALGRRLAMIRASRKSPHEG